MPDGTESTQAHLRDEFIARLADRISALQSLLDAVAKGDPESREILQHTAHGLVEAAGAHHLAELAEAARALVRIAASMPADAAPGAALLGSMRDALNRLALQARQLVRNAVPPALSLPSSRRVVIVNDDTGQGGWMHSVLEAAGYQVDVFNDFGTFSAACQNSNKPVPAAIIMDTAFAAGDAAGAGGIAGMKERCLTGLPVIFVSERHDMAAKLAAYRAGATRYLSKPLASADLLQVVADAVALLPATPYRVLVVDGDPARVESPALILRNAGMEVLEEPHPLQVPAVLENFAAELLLLDMHMPQCSGPELAAILRDDARFAEIPIVYLASENNVIQQLLALDRGGDHFLTRPLNPAHLVAMAGMHARRYRRAAEQAESMRATLYERERQQQAVDAHAIVSASNVRGDIIYVNDKFCSVSGYRREELLGKNHRIVKSGVHPSEFYADMWHTISSGRIWHGEVCNRSKEGHFYWVETSIVPFLDAHGLPYQYISIRTDITAIKAATEKLRMSEQRLNLAQEVARLGSFEWNPLTGEQYWSDEHYRLWGLQPQSVKSTFELFRQAIHPDDQPRLDEALQRAMQRQSKFDCVYRITCPDGSEHIMHSCGEFTFDDSGKAVKLVGTVQDITGRKLVEKALEESRTRLEEAQARARLGHWEADMVSGELYWSDEIYRLFGVDRENFTPSVDAFKHAIHPDDLKLVEESEQRAARTGIHDVVHRIIRRDGGVRYVHELARSQFDAQGRLVRLTGSVQDVTDLKQTELELIQARDEAEIASRAKSEFLASMSHELRTPLNAILGFSQLFSLDSQLPQETRNNAREIERAGQHLLSLVNDMIDLARIEAGKLEISIERLALRSVVRDSLTMVKPLAQEKGITLIEAAHVGPEITVFADNVRMRQVLINFLTNAIKYNKPHGSVSISCHVTDGVVRVSVADTGTGIPADKQARIFNAFDRLGEERGNVEGTGIGLVITKRLVLAMGGKIGFESTPGEGSNFWIEFPLAGGGAEIALIEPAPARTSAAEAQAPASHAAVLYIEDNPMNLRLMQRIFAGRKNLELRDATSAEAGISMARANPPALILMDINLPGMDGYAALEILQADPLTARIPVIAITANAMKGDEERGLGSGFVDYLTKPLNVPRFLAILDELFKT